MILFKPFQNLYQQLKKTDVRLFEAFDKITSFLQSISDFIGPFSNSTKVNNIPKLSAQGPLVESSITDTGLEVDFNERIVIDSGYQPAFSQVQIQASSHGMLSAITYHQANESFGFDTAFNNNTWMAYAPTVIRLTKGITVLSWWGKSGCTIGTPVGTFTALGTLDPASGYWRFGDGATAAYTVDSAGDVRATGIFRVSPAGTPGIGVTSNVVTGISVTTAVVAGVTVVTSVTPAYTSQTFVGGIRTS